MLISSFSSVNYVSSNRRVGVVLGTRKLHHSQDTEWLQTMWGPYWLKHHTKKKILEKISEDMYLPQNPLQNSFSVIASQERKGERGTEQVTVTERVTDR